MSAHPYASYLAMPRPLRLETANRTSENMSSRNLNARNFLPFMMHQAAGYENINPLVQYIQGQPYLNPQSMMSPDIAGFSPLELYNLECAKRLEAEQLAIRRRQLETIQAYRANLQGIVPTGIEASKYRVRNAESISPVPDDQDSSPSFIGPSPAASIGGSPSSPVFPDDVSDKISVDRAELHSSDESYRYRSSVSPADDMAMPPLTRIEDVDEDSGMIPVQKPSEPVPKKQNKIRCTICGEDAICKSYGAVCCDSCRLFFRRTIVKEAHKGYSCSAKRKCIVTGRHRSRCQFCRFQRCLHNGMKPEYVLKNSNEKNITSKDLIQTPSPPSPSCSPSAETSLLVLPKYNESLSNNEAFEVHGVVLQYEKMRCNMTPAPQSKIGLVISTFKDILSSYLMTNLFGRSKGMDKDMVKSIQNDSLTGALMLRMAYHYDPVVHGLPHCSLFSPSDSMLSTVDKQRMIPLSLYEDILKTLKSIHLLKIDNTVICLLILVYISHTDSSFEFYMTGSDEVTDKFTLLLKKYISSVHGANKASELFPKLLMKLVDIKELQLRLDKYVFQSVP